MVLGVGGSVRLSSLDHGWTPGVIVFTSALSRDSHRRAIHVARRNYDFVIAAAVIYAHTRAHERGAVPVLTSTTQVSDHVSTLRFSQNIKTFCSYN